MMKKLAILIFFSLFVAGLNSFGQTDDGGVSIGKGGVAANSKSILELVSQTKGLLIPRMTTGQRIAIFTAEDQTAVGLMVYDLTVNSFFYWDGSEWNDMGSSLDTSDFLIVSTDAPASPKANQVYFDTDTNLFYKYDNGTNTWKELDFGSSSAGSGITFPSTATAKVGSVFYHLVKQQFYVFNGEDWVQLSTGGSTPTGSSLPTTANVGDVFFVNNTTEKQLYIFNGTQWTTVGSTTLADGSVTESKLQAAGAIALSGGVSGQLLTSAGNNQFKWTNRGSIPGSATNPTGASAGDLYYNTADKNIYYYDGSSWIILSGVTSGTTTPSAGSGVTGETFYNTSTKSFYVYSDGVWNSIGGLSGTLASGSFLVGNASNVATATAKGEIPLSGFRAAEANVLMGGYKLTNLGNPTDLNDAANKYYVDNAINTASLSGGGTDSQTLSISGNTLYISGGNYVTLPTSSGGSGTVTGVSGTAPIVSNGSTTAPVISITAASASAAGSMSATDKAKLDKLTDISGISDANKVLTVNATGTAATWVTPSTGGGIWGSITGTLSSQTDLNSALAGKEATLGNPTTNGYVLSSTSSGVRSWVALGGGGDMLTSTYDPAGIAQQVVGTTATQTLTNKTLTSPTITTPNITYSNTSIPIAAISLTGADATKYLRGDGTWATVSSGTAVTAISVTSANGFSGSSSGGTTPALTLGTSVTGLLKGNGSAISAANAGTDYFAPGASSLTIGTGSNAVTLTAPTANSGAYNLVLPTNDGTADYVLKTDGSGVLRWDVDATGSAGSGITSIGLSLPLYNSFTTLTADGSFTGTLASQAINTVLAGPSSGSSAAPTFRALVAADIPTLSYASTTHAHGNISNSGAIGTTSGLVVVTGTSGVLQALSAGTTSQFLRGDGTWAAPSGTGNVTIGTTSIALGGSSLTLAGLTSVAATTFSGALSGNATTATTATNIAGGSAGSVLYQTASGSTSATGVGVSNQVLTSNGSSAPTWTTLSTLTNPMTTIGDLIYGAASGTATRLAAGTTTGMVLMNTASGAPSWSTLSSLPSTAGTLPIANGGTGAITAAAALTNLGAAPLASPTFTGTPAAPTATAGTSTTQLATTAFVTTALASAGDITAVTAGTGLSGGATSGAATLNLATSGVTANTYASPSSVTVDTYGRITSITAGSGGGSMPTGTTSGSTLRYNGSSWEESTAMTNDGTNVATTGKVTVGGDMKVNGNFILASYRAISTDPNSTTLDLVSTKDFVLNFTYTASAISTLTLPSVSTVDAGRLLIIKNSTGKSLNISYSSTLTTLTVGKSTMIYSDGSTWQTLGL